MKKTLAILLAMLMLLSAAACAAKSGETEAIDNYGPPMIGAADEKEYYDEAAAMPAAPEPGAEGGKGLSGLLLQSSGSGVLAEKIIYSANASIETTEYDTALQTLAELVASHDAFIENSYESGYGANDYLDRAAMAFRNSSFTLRVPSARFSEFVGALPTVGSVRNQSTNAENVTEQYTDIESRLKTYRIEEERLLAMLEKADNVSDMITIESTLSNVRYNIETVTSQLLNLDNRVNYSSVYINIQEVQKYTKVEPVNLTYGQQILEGLKNTFEGIGAFFAGFLKSLIISLPVLVILAVLAVIVIAIVKRGVKSRKKTENREDNNNG